MQSGSLLSEFLRNMLCLSKDRIICPEDGGSSFLHPVVNNLLEITPFHIPENSNHGLIKFANHIFILLLMWWLFYAARNSVLCLLAEDRHTFLARKHLCYRRLILVSSNGGCMWRIWFISHTVGPSCKG